MPAAAADDRRYRVVGFWRRAMAGVVDGIVLLPLVVLFAAVTAAVGGRPPRGLAELGPAWAMELALDGGVAGLAALMMAGIVTFLYFFIFHVIRGQTLGQRLLRARVVDAWGERPSSLRVVVRTLGSLLSLLGFSLGFLWIAFDREKRGLHDWLAGTYVIDVARAPRPVVAAAAVPAEQR